VSASQDIQVLPSGGPLGAEVRVDLRADPPGRDVYRILEAFARHHVLLFRDQQLSEQRLLEISSWFGPVYVPPRGLPMLGGADQPSVVRVSNAAADGVAGSEPLPMHSDLHNMPAPSDAALLYAVEVPPAGGETSWSNLHQAYEELDPALQARVETLRAISPNPYVGGPAARARRAAGEHQLYVEHDVPEFAHPIVRTHPLTGRRALYVGHYVERLVGLDDPEESRRLLARLQAHVDQAHLYWTHRWRPGDLLIWDNRCTNHKRAALAPGQRRTLLRIAIGGSRPF
jgi:taurine dioxygenase